MHYQFLFLKAKERRNEKNHKIIHGKDNPLDIFYLSMVHSDGSYVNV